MIRRLLSLPSELEILHLKLSSSDFEDSAVQLQFGQKLDVRRCAVQSWLECLAQNHPDFQEIPLDYNGLSLDYLSTLDTAHDLLYDE